MRKIIFILILAFCSSLYSQNEEHTHILQDTIPFQPFGDRVGDALSLKHDKIYYLRNDGETDTSVTGSYSSAFTTFADLLAKILADGVQNSGVKIIVGAGTYNESVTIPYNNFNIEAENNGPRGQTYINGTITFTANSSSNGISGINVNTLIHTGGGGLYVKGCTINQAFIKNGSGYTEISDTGMQSTASITGAGQTVIDKSKVGLVTINNASQNTTVRDCMSSGAITLTAGTLLFNNNVVFPAALNGNTITSSAGTFLFLRNTLHANLDGNLGKISIAGFYSMLGVSYDRTNSTITGTNLGYISWHDKLGVLNLETVSGNTMGLVQKADGTIAKQTITGGGGSYTLIKHAIANILDVSQAPTLQEDGKYYIFTNVANLNTGFYTVNGTAPAENDIMVYNASSDHYTRHYQVSNITQSGEYLVYVAKDGVYYYDVLLTKWKRKNTNVSKSFVASENIIKGRGVKIKNNGQVELVKAGTNESSGGLDYSTDYADKINTLIDGSRYLSFSRESLVYKMQINSVSGYTITAGSVITIAASNVVKAESHVLLGGNVIVNVILKNAGTNRIDIVPYIWNGSTYVAGTTQSFSTAVTNDFSSCLNANNTLEVQYSTGANQLKINAIITGSGVVTLGTQETVSNTPYSQYKLISGGIGGKSILFYNDGSANKYIINDTSTALVRTETAAVTMSDVTNVDGGGFRGIGKDNSVLMHYNDNDFFYAKWFDLSNNTTTTSVKSYNNIVFCDLSFSSNTLSGGAFVQLNPSVFTPTFTGWIRSGNGIVFNEPTATIGTKSLINVALGSGIKYDGTKYFVAYAGNTGGSTPYAPHMAIANFTQLSTVIPDGVAQNNANQNETVEVAINGDISNVHTGLTIGATYYLNSGTVTEAETSFRLGNAISKNEILLNFYDTNPTTDAAILSNTNAIATNTANITTNANNITVNSNNITSQGNRITALENTVVKKVAWRFPDYVVGWGAAYVYNDGEKDNVVAGGSSTATRVYGDIEDTNLITQFPIDWNGDAVAEAAYTGIAEIRFNSRNVIARTNEGKLLFGGRDNSMGQWGDGTTTAKLGGAGKLILQTQPEVYGANLFVTAIGISEDWWADDSSRTTLGVTVKNTSNNTYKPYMRGFSSNSTSDAWCLISENGNTAVKGNVTSWKNTFGGSVNVVFWHLGVFGAHIIVDEEISGIPRKNLYFSGYNVSGHGGTNTAANSTTTLFNLCYYDNGTPVNNAKWVKQVFLDGTLATTYLQTTDNKPYGCGYQGNYNCGFNSTANQLSFKLIPITDIANKSVSSIKPTRNGAAILLTNGEVWCMGYNSYQVFTDGKSSFTNGVTVQTQASTTTSNTSILTPKLTATGIDKIFCNLNRGDWNEGAFLFYRKADTKDVYFAGWDYNNSGVSDNNQDTFSNLQRIINRPSSGEYFEDIIVNGGKSNTGVWYFSTSGITNKGNVYRIGQENSLVGKTTPTDRILKKWTRILNQYQIK